MKQILKRIIPPIIIELFKQSNKYGFFGNYKNWQDALADSKGYSDPIILEKVKNSLAQVKNGHVAYERDSVVFNKIQYSWPILTSLLWISSQNNNCLNLIDFGGSLGSSYFQNIGFLKHLNNLKWNIIEQKDWVTCGNKFFRDNSLEFFDSIESCIKTNTSNVILLSSVIQYIEKPYEFAEKINKYSFDYIIFDRTTFIKDKDRLTVQKVSPRIYNVSYPAWFLNENRFLYIFKEKYRLIADFNSLAGNIQIKNEVAYEKGFIFKKL